ncbi:CDP-diacylglycerol--serine O-phosphatidyltransferase [Candidatus Peregrinibacteria bacterium]|nr:CDP-diacylglycerol--serine O-phosphatidyltransferase [Candidatus Peregrinibacteria bacterium]
MKRHIPNILTFCNLISGLGSLSLSLQQEYTWAALLIVFATIVDKLDGAAARKLGTESPIGKYLDSLSDLVSFGIAPFVFVIDQHMTPILLLTGILFVCAGTYRLARFMVKENPFFTGLPITLNGLLFPLLYFLHWNTEQVFTIAFIGMSMGMVSRIKIPKL